MSFELLLKILFGNDREAHSSFSLLLPIDVDVNCQVWLLVSCQFIKQ